MLLRRGRKVATFKHIVMAENGNPDNSTVIETKIVDNRPSEPVQAREEEEKDFKTDLNIGTNQFDFGMYKDEIGLIQFFLNLKSKETNFYRKHKKWETDFFQKALGSNNTPRTINKNRNGMETRKALNDQNKENLDSSEFEQLNTFNFGVSFKSTLSFRLISELQFEQTVGHYLDTSEIRKKRIEMDFPDATIGSCFNSIKKKILASEYEFYYVPDQYCCDRFETTFLDSGFGSPENKNYCLVINFGEINNFIGDFRLVFKPSVTDEKSVVHSLVNYNQTFLHQKSISLLHKNNYKILLKEKKKQKQINSKTKKSTLLNLKESKNSKKVTDSAKEKKQKKALGSSSSPNSPNSGTLKVEIQ